MLNYIGRIKEVYTCLATSPIAPCRIACKRIDIETKHKNNDWVLFIFNILYICIGEKLSSKRSQDVKEIYGSIAEDRNRHFGAVADCRFVARPHETRFCRSYFYAMQFGRYLRRVSCKTEKQLIYNYINYPFLVRRCLCCVR